MNYIGTYSTCRAFVMGTSESDLEPILPEKKRKKPQKGINEKQNPKICQRSKKNTEENYT